MSAQTPGSKAENKTVFQLIGELPEILSDLISSEIEFLKKQAITGLKNAGIGIGLFVAAAVFLYFALWVFIATAILGIATALPPWLAALIVAVALLIIAVVFALIGVNRIKKGNPVPPESIDSLKSDVQAFKGTGNYDH